MESADINLFVLVVSQRQKIAAVKKVKLAIPAVMAELLLL
jgi:hypothetical protein